MNEMTDPIDVELGERVQGLEKRLLIPTEPAEFDAGKWLRFQNNSVRLFAPVLHGIYEQVLIHEYFSIHENQKRMTGWLSSVVAHYTQPLKDRIEDRTRTVNTLVDRIEEAERQVESLREQLAESERRRQQVTSV